MGFMVRGKSNTKQMAGSRRKRSALVACDRYEELCKAEVMCEPTWEDEKKL